MTDKDLTDSNKPDELIVFEYWVQQCRNKGRKPVLDDKRRRTIKKALKTHGMETCKLAIDGILLSPFHQGQNQRRKKYDDINLILRDAERIEQFADLADEGGDEQWIAGN